MITSAQVKLLARETGFHACGITKAKRLSEAEGFVKKWVKAGNHGELKYMERFESRANNFWARLPWAKSVIMLGVNYYSQSRKDAAPIMTGLYGRVARYAWGKDYHPVINKRMEALKQKIISATQGEIQFESTVDTKPVLERALARSAGLGFIGRQGQLISLEYGPWLFLAGLITSLDLEPDEPNHDKCGRCGKCLMSCPGGALAEEGGIDAGKCVACLTIEHEGEISEKFARRIGDRIFGCDACLEACPFGAWQKETDWPEFKPEAGVGPVISLREMVEIRSDEEFKARFVGTPLERAGRKKLLRNASIVLRNLMSNEF